jgi:hypothetical protein
MKPQSYFIRHGELDFIGRYETLQLDWARLCRIANLGTIELKHINKSNHVDYKECYTSATKKIIAEVYQEDVDRFKYTFS